MPNFILAEREREREREGGRKRETKITQNVCISKRSRAQSVNTQNTLLACALTYNNIAAAYAHMYNVMYSEC